MTSIKKLSTFYATDDSGRTAEVALVDDVPRVYMFLDKELLDVEDFPNNTVQYAEDAAENYVLGIKQL